MPLPGQEAVARFYDGNKIQVGVAILIGTNFLTNIVEKEIDPRGTKYAEVFEAFELFYNICFTIELFVNMYAHWAKPFWQSTWNVFDVVVVTIGVVLTIKLPLPPAFAMLRMMRAFRVFRLFKRVHSLNKIIVAIAHAVPGVINAFLILTIVMSIYAILAVEFYFEIGDDCKEEGGDKRFLTARGFCAGAEYFGTFSKSLFTFFQVLTGESWSEAVARTAIWFYYDDPMRALGSGLFFVSYMLVTSFVLTNVVVAVLLDKMVDPEVEEHTVTSVRRSMMTMEELDLEDEQGRNAADTVSADPTPADLKLTMSAVTEQVQKLVQASEMMNGELGSFRTDMISMREQVAGMVTFTETWDRCARKEAMIQ